MSEILIDSHYYANWSFARSGVTQTGIQNLQLQIFCETSGTPMWTGTVPQVGGFSGLYSVHAPALGVLGFATGQSYSIWVTGILSGQPVREFINRFTPRTRLFNGISGIATPIYHAQINHCYVKPSGLDRWTTLWFKNGSPYSVWSTGRLNVFNASGNLYFGNSGLTAYGVGISGGQLTIGGTGILKSGERYLAQTTAFIDGATRTWSEHVGYDI